MDFIPIKSSESLLWEDLSLRNVGITGGDAFLIQTASGAFLCDSGFAHGAPVLIKQIEETLRVPFTHILLTHSHYDHVMGSAACTQKWPNLCVVASEYAQKILNKASARDFMENMDNFAAEESGKTPIPGLSQHLRVDLTVKDGDFIHLPGIDFQAVFLPGHTNCSFGFYDKEREFLICSESVGVLTEKDKIVPAYLVSYEDTISSIQKVRSLAPKAVLLPHTGLVTGANVKEFLEIALYWAQYTNDFILSLHRKGLNIGEIIEKLKELFYNDSLREFHSEKAFTVNVTHMIKATLKTEQL